MDETTYITLSQDYLPALFRMACSILRSRADAEDAVQQTLLLAWQHRATARPGFEKPWMMRILINTSRSMLRKRRPSIPIEEVSLAAPAPGDEALKEAIHALPEALRTPLLLKYMEDSKPLWDGNLDEMRYEMVGSAIGTHAGPGAVAVAFFRN